jgi:DNA polymerase III epsilon subunit family exonuclease
MSFLNSQSGNRKDVQFSVVDVETTGLFPERNDRIIEIAVISVNSTGEVMDQYSTLVNPVRDLGPTHIHHITSAEIKGAPRFAEVVGDVLSRLRGTVFAGYYPHFDFRFLRSEVNRLGHEVPPVGLLCVNELARDVAPDLPGRKLEICCKHFGIPLSESHTARADAVATANVLRECSKRSKLDFRTLLTPLNIQPFPDLADVWPGLRINGKSYTRASAAEAMKSEPNYIAKLIASLPIGPKSDQSLDRYFALLDHVLEDRVVTPDEATMLFDLAREVGISQGQAEDAHCKYTRDLVFAALADEVVTQKEEEDLRHVARVLSIPDSKFEEILAEATANPAISMTSITRTTTPKNDLAGLSICFTGEFTCRINGNLAARHFAEAIAQKRGMIVRKGVTKDLDVLVVADPNSMSGKAKKARQYGIRIVVEPVFWHWMDINIG